MPNFTPVIVFTNQKGGVGKTTSADANRRRTSPPRPQGPSRGYGSPGLAWANRVGLRRERHLLQF